MAAGAAAGLAHPVGGMEQRQADRKCKLKRELERLKALNAAPEDDETPPEGAAAGGGSGAGPGGSGLPGRWRDLEQSPETTRKRKSKFDLTTYLDPKLTPKQLEELPFSDFVYASMRWGVDFEDPTVEELKGYMAHRLHRHEGHQQPVYT